MKADRHDAILSLLRARRVRSQDELRRLLAERGFQVTQGTLSRDLRELRIVKVPDREGQAYYTLTAESERGTPGLDDLLPQLMVSAEGVGNLLVVKTLAGGAQAVAEAIDLAAWPEILGTVAGDDTILLVLRHERDRESVRDRLESLSGTS